MGTMLGRDSKVHWSSKDEEKKNTLSKLKSYHRCLPREFPSRESPKRYRPQERREVNAGGKGIKRGLA